jgi:YVTN family beta-propeller protein
VYVGLENDDQMVAIDTLTNTVIATVPIGQGAQAIVYVPNAVAEGAGTEGLQPLGLAGQVARFEMEPTDRSAAATAKTPTSVTLFDQGLVQVLEAAVTGLEPKHLYVLALSDRADGGGALQPLASFMTNPAGAAIVNAVGPIRQLVQGGTDTPRRYLVIVEGTTTATGKAVQVQTD